MINLKILARIIVFILILSLIYTTEGQNINENTLRKQVIKKGIVDSLFIFCKWSKDGDTESHLKYLGQVTTTKGRVLKIMNSSWFWGLSHRATSRILIYNNKNQYLGYYYLTMVYDLPYKLEKGILYFSNKDKEECDINIITTIDFTKGLPKSFFLKCDKVNGDIYSFSSDY